VVCSLQQPCAGHWGEECLQSQVGSRDPSQVWSIEPGSSADMAAAQASASAAVLAVAAPSDSRVGSVPSPAPAVTSTFPASPLMRFVEGIPWSSEWALGQELGKGTFGTVYSVRRLQTTEKFAVKVIEGWPDLG
jgi:serine/threonine protein kinase